MHKFQPSRIEPKQTVDDIIDRIVELEKTLVSLNVAVDRNDMDLEIINKIKGDCYSKRSEKSRMQ